MSKLVLCGYMGSGKTTIGQAISKHLGIPFFDLDALIVQQEGKSIAEVFKSKGEIYFRKVEHQVLVDFFETTPHFVLALGGGTPLYYNNNKLCFATSHQSFYLDASIKLLVSRLENETHKRPLIAHLNNQGELEDFIRKHLFERRPVYAQAQHQVKLDGKSIAQVTSEIISLT